mmetsp:Transcript_13244/g.28101  ORF Transcript_13244/g.28101 Transcript_13244/m.28101 type:complete len:242 (-) Transcript_13244:591-1316(-)
MEFDPENLKFLDGLDDVFLQEILEFPAANEHLDIAGFDVHEDGQLNDAGIVGAHTRAGLPTAEELSSSSSSSFSVSTGNDDKHDGDVVNEIFDLADMFKVYEVGELKNGEPDGNRTSMDSVLRGETITSQQAKGRSSSSSRIPDKKREGDHVEDETPKSKRYQLKADRVEDKESERKRQARLVRNRNSAALSRWRKRAGMETLEKRNSELERANARLSYLLASASMVRPTLIRRLYPRHLV